MERRKFLTTVAVAGAVGLTGCTGGDGDDGGNGGDSSGNGGDNGGENGSDNGGENGGDNGGENGGDNGGENGSDNGGENGSDNGGENGGDNGGENGSGNGGSSDGPALSDSFNWDSSFIAEMTLNQPEMGESTVTMRFNSGNWHQTLESDQGTFDIYQVDGDVYMVQESGCIKNPGQTPTPESGVSPENQNAVEEEYPDLTPEGQETIDGEEVYVYEAESEGQTVTWYVSVESGYLRRMEFDGGTIDYHSWGEVDPIEAPDANCQEIGSGGNGGGDGYGG